MYKTISQVLWALMPYVAKYHPKLQLWVTARSNHPVMAPPQNQKKVLWVICASLGEYLQAKPVLQAIKNQYPSYYIVISFFSPSGFVNNKTLLPADAINLLPPDTPKNAKATINTLRPNLVVFVKKELWYHYLTELKNQNIPTILLGLRLAHNNLALSPFGGFFRQMLLMFNHIITTDLATKKLCLEKIKCPSVSIGGDTRFDQVAQLPLQKTNWPKIDQFVAGHTVLVAGSIWPQDVDALFPALHHLPKPIRIIVAPHQIDLKFIEKIKNAYYGRSICYSEIKRKINIANYQMLIIDNVGMLSQLYAYGHIAYVGGAFKQGLHNILEPAAFGLPILFGPKYKKFPEAVALLQSKAAHSINSPSCALNILSNFISAPGKRAWAGKAAYKFVQSHTGTTQIAIKDLKKYL